MMVPLASQATATEPSASAARDGKPPSSAMTSACAAVARLNQTAFPSLQAL